MSLAIDVEKVVQVLLADGWHTIKSKSFSIDAYEYLEYPDNPKPDDDGFPLLGGGRDDHIASHGFVFVEAGPGGVVIAGPLTSVLAVRLKQ